MCLATVYFLKYYGPSRQAMQAHATPGCRELQWQTWGCVKQQWALARQQKHSSCGKYSFHLLLHLVHGKYWGTALPLPREDLIKQWASLCPLSTTVYKVMSKVCVNTSRHGDPYEVPVQTSQLGYIFWPDFYLAIIKLTFCFSILAVSNRKESCTGPAQ